LPPPSRRYAAATKELLIERRLDIALSIVSGILIAVTLALAVLVLTTDGGSQFDVPKESTSESVGP